ncbi:hypothetical protein D6C90_01450 [Aureobasidium pullulans]|uniref:Uncharacterized protein n=1 Tax=Aureobasidium pullulans TaxID=5580 RepID=A0A4S9VIY4_AURPU|nr:hypothetical protein D6C90_01450 [Aureobasidium pullulans]
MRVYAAPARTRGNGGNFNITQAAGRRTAICRRIQRTASPQEPQLYYRIVAMQQNVQVLGSALLCVHRVFLFLGGFLGGLTDPVEMALGFLNAGPGLTRELSWVPKLEFGKHFMDLLSTRFPPGHAETIEELSVEESDVGVVLDLAVGQRGTPTPRMLETHAPIRT